jgi:hypothetical protein
MIANNIHVIDAGQIGVIGKMLVALGLDQNIKMERLIP